MQVFRPAASSGPIFSEIGKNRALAMTGIIGAAALAVAAYAATAIFVPSIRGSLTQTGATLLAASMGVTALVVGGGALTFYVLKPSRESTKLDSTPIREELSTQPKPTPLSQK